MKTTTLQRSTASLAAAKALIAGQQAASKPEFDYAGFFAKCDTLTLTSDDALAYLGESESKYPVLKSDEVTEDVELVATLLPSNPSRKNANRAKRADGSQRLHLAPGQEMSVRDRLIALSGIEAVKTVKAIPGMENALDLDRLTINNVTAYKGELRNVYAGVDYNGQVFRVGGNVTNALAICSALPDAKLVFVVTPIGDTDEA